MSQTFSDFKKDFYSRITDMSVFDCQDFNLLKVVLDGLKVNYVNKGFTDITIFRNAAFAEALFFAKRLKYAARIKKAVLAVNQLNSQRNKKYLLFDNGRVSLNREGERISFYFDNIKNFLGEQNHVTILQTNAKLTGAVSINELMLSTLFKAFEPKEMELIAAIRQTFQRIFKEISFSTEELQNIRISMNKFFNEYRLWKFILKNLNVKYCLFDEHYHREGFLLALKRAAVKSVELQHGLIAKEDIFYIFPDVVKPVASKALFPDKILTYGKYWSDLLKTGAEFGAEKIDVIGSYQAFTAFVTEEQEKELYRYTNSGDFILITTQTFLHDQFNDYITWLSADLFQRSSPLKIVVKLHPSEKNESYKPIQNLSNVKIIDFNTEYLLSRCKYHISVYSTTLYDGLKYSCLNYSLEVSSCMDYVRVLVSSGVSALLPLACNPLDVLSVTNKPDVSLFYESFSSNKEKLLHL